MREVGIDISGGTPKSVDQFVDQPFDYVITVCDDAEQNCPNFSGKVGKRVHLGFVDPAAASGAEDAVMAVFRRVRDPIRQEVLVSYEPVRRRLIPPGARNPTRSP